MNGHKNSQKSYDKKEKRQSFNKEDDFTNKIVDALGVNYVKEILIEKKTDYNLYIDKLKKFTESIYKDVSTSQIRNVFYEVKKAKEPTDVYVLRPKFAYISGRTDNSKAGMKTFLHLLDLLAKEIKDKKQLNEFKNFFESIISYHKYYGGKD